MASSINPHQRDDSSLYACNIYAPEATHVFCAAWARSAFFFCWSSDSRSRAVEVSPEVCADERDSKTLGVSGFRIPVAGRQGLEMCAADTRVTERAPNPCAARRQLALAEATWLDYTKDHCGGFRRPFAPVQSYSARTEALTAASYSACFEVRKASISATASSSAALRRASRSVDAGAVGLVRGKPGGGGARIFVLPVPRTPLVGL